MTEACESVKKCRKVRMLLQNQFFFMLASKMCWVCWVLLLFAGCWYIHKKYCRPIIWIYYSLLDSHAELAAELTLFEFPAYRSSFLSNRTCGSTLTHWGLFYWLLWNTCKTKQSIQNLKGRLSSKNTLLWNLGSEVFILFCFLNISKYFSIHQH